MMVGVLLVFLLPVEKVWCAGVLFSIGYWLGRVIDVIVQGSLRGRVRRRMKNAQHKEHDQHALPWSS